MEVFNYYSKYNYNKYNILNSCLQFIFYTLSIKTNTDKYENYRVIIIDKIIKILEVLDTEIDLLLKATYSNELEIFINLVISNIYLIINRFTKKEVNFDKNKFFGILESIVRKLITQLEYQNNFHTLIIYVLHSYLRLTKLYDYNNIIVQDELKTKYRTISLIIRKISNLTQEHEFLAILNFLIRVVDLYSEVNIYW